jgi:hypothetical protein
MPTSAEKKGGKNKKKCQFNTLDSCKYISYIQPKKYDMRYISKDVNGFFQVIIYIYMSLCLINTFLTLPLDGRASGFMSGYFNPTEKSCQVPTGQDVGWP